MFKYLIDLNRLHFIPQVTPKHIYHPVLPLYSLWQMIAC